MVLWLLFGIIFLYHLSDYFVTYLFNLLIFNISGFI